MTNGTSQGLFIVVAIIIFGIFVLISYILFKDTIKTSLSAIFTDSLGQVEGTSKNEDDSSPIFKFDSSTGEIKGFKEGYATSEDTLIIPEEINGKAVTKISDGAFKEEQFKKLVLPDGIVEIGEEAFYNSPLEEANLDDATIVGKDAFYNSTFLEKKSTLDFSLSSTNTSQMLILDGNLLDFLNPLNTIKGNNNLNQGKKVFIFSNENHDYVNGTINESYNYSMNYSSNYKNGNEPKYQRLDASNFLNIASDDFTLENINYLKDYLSNNKGNLKFSKDAKFIIRVSQEDVKIKTIKINGKEVSESNIDVINKDNGKAIYIDGSYFQGVQPAISSGSSIGFRLNSDEEILVSNIENNNTIKSTTLDYLGKRYNRTNSDGYNVSYTYSFPVEIESVGGMKYSFDLAYSLNFNLGFNFGAK
ncbi:leucine-rich repeat protein [Enterococcus avium]|uniref:leucine-rich repeat protein n=1 Tax=Enterococcus avium TaxID=33945 RepID=UPI00288E9B7A|nr:leucine-rich repeat protein [Enterococcus avium]MDT2481110.1 leucine-rich repeat protein [Enterococcus avium]